MRPKFFFPGFWFTPTPRGPKYWLFVLASELICDTAPLPVLVTLME
jgi:hypothetical protein